MFGAPSSSHICFYHGSETSSNGDQLLTERSSSGDCGLFSKSSSYQINSDLEIPSDNITKLDDCSRNDSYTNARSLKHLQSMTNFNDDHRMVSQSSSGLQNDTPTSGRRRSLVSTMRLSKILKYLTHCALIYEGVANSTPDSAWSLVGSPALALCIQKDEFVHYYNSILLRIRQQYGLKKDEELRNEHVPKDITLHLYEFAKMWNPYFKLS